MFQRTILKFTISAAIAAGLPVAAQTAQKKPVDRAAAYYHYSMGHLYAELAGAYGNKSDYVNKALENYRLALKADPNAAFIAEELSDLYIQSGRLADGVREAEELLKANPDDVNPRRILGRMYMRMIGDPQARAIDETMLKRAAEQYQKIVERVPDDADSWLMLGRLQKIGQNPKEAEKSYKKVLELDPSSEDAMIGLAMVYSDMGDVKAATDLLRRIADKSPSFRSLTNLANAYEQQREFGLAAEVYRKTLELVPSNIEVKRALAQTLMYADQIDEALKNYKQIVDQDPRDVQSWLRLSQIHRQRRDLKQAREAADKAKALEPNSLDIRYNEVNLLDAEGRTPEAITALKEIIDSTVRRSYTAAEKSNRAMLLERLGLLYRASEQYANAVSAFRQAGEYDPESGARISAQVIDTLRAARDYAKAEEEADAAIKKYPNDRTVRLVRATMLVEAGKGEQGIADARQLIDGKQDREAYISLAQLYEKTKNYSEMSKAIDAAEKLSTSKEDKETTHFLRGAMYEKQKKYDLAEAEFRKVLELNPESASALNYLGYMLADRNVRLSEAHQLISKAIDMDPNNGAYLDSLGWVLYRLNRLPEAEEKLVRAIERVRRDPTVHDHLADVYFRQGKIKEAIQHWQVSLKEWEASPKTEFDGAEVAKIQRKLEGARVRLAKENTTATPAKP